MVKIELVERDYLSCQSCNKTKDVKKIAIGYDETQTSSFRICESCLLIIPNKELETTKRQLEESIQLIEEMCVDDCGIDLAKEDRESLESIIMGNDEKCIEFLNKLQNERGE